MLQIYLSKNQTLEKIDQPEAGSWISLTKPTEEELNRVEQELGVEPSFLRAALDSEEAPRIDKEEGQLLLIVDAAIRSEDKQQFYITIPMGIIILKQHIITVCLTDDTVLEAFKKPGVKDFYTQFKTRFVLQILYRNAAQYLTDLKVLDKMSTRLERTLHDSLRNRELLEMLKIEKSLVYFSTSLRGNETVLERLLRQDLIKNYPEDADFLDDVIIENKQAIEMCNVYVTILTSTMDAYASVISNNQNNVMKILTSVTLVMAVPTIVSGYFGMNVPVPMSIENEAFWLIIAGTTVFMIVLIYILHKVRML